MTEAPIKILDTTLREGQQGRHPVYPDRGIVFSHDQQLIITELLSRMGVDYIEVTAPFNSPQALQTTKEIVATAHSYPNTEVFIHARCTQEDIDAALLTNPDGINLYKGTSEENRAANGKHTILETAELAKDATRYIRKKNPKIFVRFSTEDAFRTPQTDLETVIAAVHPFVDRIGLPDTTGGADPEDVLKVVSQIVNKFGLETEFHGHNDFGLAPINYLQALRAGAKVFDATILGVGERNGIISLSGLMALLYKYEKAALKKYSLTHLNEIDQTVAGMLETIVPLSQPLSPSAFVHGAGVHTNAMLNNPDSYSVIEPADFGRTTTLLTASVFVGGKAIQSRAVELGLELKITDAKNIAALVRETARSNGSISSAQVDKIIINNSL